MKPPERYITDYKFGVDANGLLIGRLVVVTDEVRPAGSIRNWTDEILYPIPGVEITVGRRGGGADIGISPSDLISRQHLSLLIQKRVSGKLLVTDTSTNGTCVYNECGNLIERGRIHQSRIEVCQGSLVILAPETPETAGDNVRNVTCPIGFLVISDQNNETCLVRVEGEKKVLELVDIPPDNEKSQSGFVEGLLELAERLSGSGPIIEIEKIMSFLRWGAVHLLEGNQLNFCSQIIMGLEKYRKSFEDSGQNNINRISLVNPLINLISNVERYGLHTCSVRT